MKEAATGQSVFVSSNESRAEARALIAKAARLHAPVDAYVDRILASGDRDSVKAVIFYGSRLSDVTALAGSFHDFYVIVDSYARFLPRWRDRFVARFVPPNVYYQAWEAEGVRYRCKYCVISTDDLLRETSLDARDVHHLGRFSKRIAVPYARDGRSFDFVVNTVLAAIRTLLPHAMTLAGRDPSPDDLIKALLSISYLGEQRVSEGNKVDALFAAAPEYYRDLIGLLSSEPVTPVPQAELAQLLRRSRRRGRLRWPKYIVTFGESWLDYLLDKVERNYGVRIELSPLERKYPLIFGWPKFFKLRRRGVIR